MRIARADLPDNGQRGVVRLVGRKQDFVCGIVLAKKAFDVLSEPRLLAVDRLQHGDWRQVRGQFLVGQSIPARAVQEFDGPENGQHQDNCRSDGPKYGDRQENLKNHETLPPCNKLRKIFMLCTWLAYLLCPATSLA